jgi:hypothetical protein
MRGGEEKRRGRGKGEREGEGRVEERGKERELGCNRCLITWPIDCPVT